MKKNLPPTVNLHNLISCNYRCRFCYAGFASANDDDESTALVLAVRNQMRDVVAMLLGVGANANHRCFGGPTALAFAIMLDDLEMTKLLLEHRADYRLHVEALGRPIYMMQMSERLRQVIPHRI